MSNRKTPTSFRTLKEAQAVSYTLSNPSKMPGRGYSIPAVLCQVGSKLRKVKDSVCSSCYALKGRYVFRNVQDAMERRYQSLDHPLWVEAMAFQISHYAAKGEKFFRWHDSGDLQSTEHLRKICAVAELTPEVSHWLPTREFGIVDNYTGKVPDNLIIRVSAPIIGTRLKKSKFPTSTVSYAESDYHCPAYTQGGFCGECRACWDPKVSNVNYPLH